MRGGEGPSHTTIARAIGGKRGDGDGDGDGDGGGDGGDDAGVARLTGVSNMNCFQSFQRVVGSPNSSAVEKFICVDGR